MKMKNFIYILQCVVIVAYGVCALMVGVSMACSCSTPDITPEPATIMSDSVEHQLATCERLLDECVRDSMLDDNGVQMYHTIRKNPSVERYIELISECEREDNFYDTIGEGDAWLDYVVSVLEPRGLVD